VASKHTGRGQLIARLTDQVGSKQAALEILQKRGHVDKDGNLTAAGRKRDEMTAAERAIDRARKTSGKPSSKYKYNPKTNRATLR
jgi:hypothetical protein